MSVDVLVVGAGPVGLALATDLARRGVAVRIIDQLASPTTESRAVVVHARSLEMLDILGVAEAIEASGFRTTATDFHSGGQTIAHVSLDTVDSPFPFSVTTPQTETERILTERLTELGVGVDRAVTFTGLVQRENGVSVSVRNEQGEEETIECAFLVGTDGAHSSIRHALDMKLEGSFHGERFLMGDVEAEHPHDKHAIHIFFSSGDTTGILFTMSETRLRIIVQIPEGQDEGRQASEEWLAQAVDERGMDIRITDTHWLTTFEVHHAQVPHYRVGRVFLAGDAAHVHSPAGGQGMNTGMQDAFNLSWKLAAVLGGAEDAERLLDSYHDERYPIARHVIRFSTALTRAGTVSSGVVRRVRNALMKTAFSTDAAQHRVADEIEEINVDYRDSAIVVKGGFGKIRPGDAARDVEGGGIWDLVLAADPRNADTVLVLPDASGATADFDVPEGVSVVTLGVGGEVRDRIGDAYGIEGGGAILIRPDGYVTSIVRGDRAHEWAKTADQLRALHPRR